MFIWAHSAGNGPLGQYIGRPDLYGIGVKGAIFMSGNPVNFGPPNQNAGRGGPGGGAGGNNAAGRGGPGGAPQAPTGQIGTSTCTNFGGNGGQGGAIRGPSSVLMDQGATAANRRKELAGTSPWRWDGNQWISTGPQSEPPAPAAGRGGGGGRGNQPAAAPSDAPVFTTQDGFRSTRVAIMLAYAELDGGVGDDLQMPAASRAVHDELCRLEGPKAKDGVGHCPTMFMAKGESHMSEVFSIGSSDKTVSNAVLAFINAHK
jgi:hypothetical protein